MVILLPPNQIRKLSGGLQLGQEFPQAPSKNGMWNRTGGFGGEDNLAGKLLTRAGPLKGQ